MTLKIGQQYDLGIPIQTELTYFTFEMIKEFRLLIKKLKLKFKIFHSVSFNILIVHFP